MRNAGILHPVFFALALWTMLGLTLVAIARFRAAFRRQVRPDLRYGESQAVPGNKVVHRLAVFALGNLVLLVLWVVIAIAIAQ